MGNKGFLKFFGVALLTSILAACGGGGASFGGTGGTTGGSGGTGATGIPGSLAFAPANGSSSAVTVGQSIALIATLTDTGGVPLADKTLNFATTAGTLATTTGKTNSTGKVTVFLKASDQTGSATVSVIEPVTNIGGSTSITFTAAGAGGITITVAPTAVAPGALASVNAQVTDAGGNPVSGQLVNFGFSTTGSGTGNSSGGLYTQAQVVTDANGRATTTYQAGPTPGTDTLKASLAGSQSITTSLQVVTGTVQVGSITLALGASSAIANGTMPTAATATVKGPGGAVLTGVTVTFSTSTNVLSPDVTGTVTHQTLTAQTDANGVAQVFQISPKLVGNGVITASTGGFSASQPIVFIAGNVVAVTMSASPNTVAPNGTSTITAQLTDVNGNLVGNHTVQFSAPVGQFSGGGLVLNGTTNDQGVVSVSYTAPVSGTITITGTAEPEGGSIKNTTNVTVNTAAAPVTGVAVSAGPSSIPANGTSTSIVRATVTGASGALPNVQVNFTATAGSLSSSSATTDANGNATVTLTSTASTLPITSTVTAATGGVSSTTTVAFTAASIASIAVTLTPPTVAINGTTTVRATVIGSDNNPVSGAAVNFSVTTNNSHGALAASSAITNTSGVATTTYTAGNNRASAATPDSPVTDTFQASSGGVTSTVLANLSVTNTVQTQTVTLLASSPDLSSSASTSAQGVTLTAVVKDSNNNVVPNVSVQFKALRNASSSCGSGGALQLVNSGITDTTGQAKAILFTGGDPTNQTIDVTAKTGTITSSVVQVTEKGTKLTIDGPTSVGLNGAATYIVTLADAGNNPISNQQIQIASAAHNLAPAGTAQITALTNSSGQVTAPYSAVTVGTDTLSANLFGCVSASSPAAQTIQVANQNLTIIAPNDSSQIPFGSGGTFSVGVAVASGGTGYVAGDVLTISGGTSTIPARVTVTQIGAGGVITDFNVTNAGTYTVLPSSPAASAGGSGSGATFTVSQNITVKLTGGTVNGKTITLNTTRGTLSASSVLTNGGGVATATITQPSAAGNSGGAVITATCTDCSPTISASVSVQFNATTPASITLQATPSTVAVSGTSAIKATVRDASNNPVANQLVQFTLVDNSGGALLQSSATTNSAGDANVTYKAGPTSGSLDGVVITGKVGSSVTGTTKLTVGGLALRISLGTGNNISVLNTTQFQYPYTVLVTDSAGNPPPAGSIVNLKINAVAYQKGHFTGSVATGWSQVQEIDCSNDLGCGTTGSPPVPDATAFGCFNEDKDLDGILNSAFDSDYNNNGTLEPGNPESVPVSVALDSNGTGQFFVTYLKDRAMWVQVKLIATITVNGDQGRTEVSFILPGLSADYLPGGGPPPGQVSPYGDNPAGTGPGSDTCATKPPA